MLFLIFAHRNMGGFVHQDVGGLEDWVGIEPDAGALLVLAAFVLELGHTIQPTQARDTVEYPGEFGVSADRGLREYDCAFWIDAGGDVGGRDLARLGGERLGILPGRDGVEIDDAEKALHLILERYELHQRAEIVAKVQCA